MDGVILGVSDFVALLNATLEFAYPSVVISGELANFRVSKNKWVYFDLKDELASVKFFGTIYQLPGPLEDGMVLQVRGVPRLHQNYGFSLTIQTIQPVGEGTIRRAAALLESKLAAEGLFEAGRKRALLYPPTHIGLITSSESAAYADFIKIINQRWGGMRIDLFDVQVQGEVAAMQIVQAVEYFNQLAKPPEVLVVTRGGGSADDLAAFSTEQVTRAVAGSRIPTLVAVGHENDTSLAEIAADKRASTPSNAAELLVPDKHHVLQQLTSQANQFLVSIASLLTNQRSILSDAIKTLGNDLGAVVNQKTRELNQQKTMLDALNPQTALRRGYAIIRLQGKTIRSGKQLKRKDKIMLTISDAEISAQVDMIRLQ